MSLRLGQANVNSLVNKMDYLNEFVRRENIDIIAVGETWLTSAVPSSFVTLTGYTIVRGDTDSAVRKHGVCLYVRREVRFVCIELDIANAAAVHLLDFDVWLIAAYRPPSYSEADNARLVQVITDFCEGREVVVVGDFNLPTLRWCPEHVLNGYISPTDLVFLNCFVSLGLTQWVFEGTYHPSGSILDLFLTSEEERVGAVEVFPPFPRCMHSPVVCDYLFCLNQEIVRQGTWRPKFQWFRGNYASISSALSEVDWELEFMYLGVQDSYEVFLSIIMQLVNHYVPVSSGDPSPPWSVRPPRVLGRDRSNAWRHYKYLRSIHGRSDDRTLLAMDEFRQANSRYRNFVIHSRCEYEKQLMDRYAECPRLFHSYIRMKKKGKLSVGPLLLEDGTLVDSPEIMSEALAEAFASVYNWHCPLNPAANQNFLGNMPDVEISREKVLTVLDSLDPTGAAGPDAVHPKLLRSCAGELAGPLQFLFVKSLLEGVVPDAWRESVIIPIHKGGSRYEPLNYRPVSLTSVPCKCMERILVMAISDYLEGNDILSRHQFGFRKGRSTEDQLLLTYAEVSSWMDAGYIVDVVLLDFSKAFDVVNHRILISKLREIGISEQVVVWVQSLIGGRSMRVAVDGVESLPREVGSGVPQGSVVGPILFLIYVNYLSAGLFSSCKSFADDFKLYLRYKRDENSGSLGRASLQTDLDRISLVAGSWNLALNPEKCVVLRFARGSSGVATDFRPYYLNGRALRFVQSHRDLGVVVDVRMRFHQHVREVVAKASGLASNILRSTVCREPDFMVTLFVTHIRPILDYCSSVWNVGYLGDSRLLEAVQRSWTRNIEGLAGLNYSARLESLGLFSVKGRLVRSDLIKYWKIVRGCTEDSEIAGLLCRTTNTRTRGHGYRLHQKNCATDAKIRFFDVRCVHRWNQLPAHVVEADSLASFKRMLAEHLGGVLFQFD